MKLLNIAVLLYMHPSHHSHLMHQHVRCSSGIRCKLRKWGIRDNSPWRIPDVYSISGWRVRVCVVISHSSGERLRRSRLHTARVDAWVEAITARNLTWSVRLVFHWAPAYIRLQTMHCMPIRSQTGSGKIFPEMPIPSWNSLQHDGIKSQGKSYFGCPVRRQMKFRASALCQSG